MDAAFGAWCTARSNDSSVRTLPRSQVMGHFRPEFVNRIDEFIVFDALRQDQISKIVGLQATRINKRLAGRKMSLQLSPAALQFLAEVRRNPKVPLRSVPWRCILLVSCVCLCTSASGIESRACLVRLPAISTTGWLRPELRRETSQASDADLLGDAHCAGATRGQYFWHPASLRSRSSAPLRCSASNLHTLRRSCPFKTTRRRSFAGSSQTRTQSLWTWQPGACAHANTRFPSLRRAA